MTMFIAGIWSTLLVASWSIALRENVDKPVIIVLTFLMLVTAFALGSYTQEKFGKE